MRIIVGWGKRMWMLENSSKVVKVNLEEGSSDDAEIDAPVGMDPHGTLSAHTEISGSGIDLHNWRFGFSAPVVNRDGS